jgi:hypothetical protein
MPWVGTIPDINGLYHLFPPTAKVRKIKVFGKELRGTIKKNGEKITVKWIDKDESAETIKSKNSAVAAKMITDANNDVFFAKSAVCKLRSKPVQMTNEIDAAYDVVKLKVRRYGELTTEKVALIKEYEDASA